MKKKWLRILAHPQQFARIITRLQIGAEKPPNLFFLQNGEGDLVVMDIETFNRREMMLRLREELLAVEEDRIAGRKGCTLDELNVTPNKYHKTFIEKW